MPTLATDELRRALDKLSAAVNESLTFTCYLLAPGAPWWTRLLLESGSHRLPLPDSLSASRYRKASVP